MASKTNIEWTEFNWNPLSGCSRKSAGCENCYAETMTKRLAAMGQEKYRGLLNEHDRFNGIVKFSEADLLAPLKRRKPTMWFVNSMSDPFHSNVPDEWIDRMFAVMALCPQHTFQILTKRPERMKEYITTKLNDPGYWGPTASEYAWHFFGNIRDGAEPIPKAWPFPNVWLGVSVEDQKTADERIPLLLDTPAAVRWISAEPLLGPIDLTSIKFPNALGNEEDWNVIERNLMANGVDDPTLIGVDDPILDWVVVGGESGPRSRPCDITNIRSIVEQCKAAGVPVFVKQLGAKSFFGVKGFGPLIRDRKGGKPDEWPSDLRVREFPAVANDLIRV